MESHAFSAGEANVSTKSGSRGISTVAGDTIWSGFLDPWKIIPGCPKDLVENHCSNLTDFYGKLRQSDL